MIIIIYKRNAYQSQQASTIQMKCLEPLERKKPLTRQVSLFWFVMEGLQSEQKYTENVSLQAKLKMFHKWNLHNLRQLHRTIQQWHSTCYSHLHSYFLVSLLPFKITPWWNQVRYWPLAKFRWHLCPEEWIELFVRYNTNIVYGRRIPYFLTIWIFLCYYMGAKGALSDFRVGNCRCRVHARSSSHAFSQIIPQCDYGGDIVHGRWIKRGDGKEESTEKIKIPSQTKRNKMNDVLFGCCTSFFYYYSLLSDRWCAEHDEYDGRCFFICLLVWWEWQPFFTTFKKNQQPSKRKVEREKTVEKNRINIICKMTS